MKEIVKFRGIKSELRILGIDSCPSITQKKGNITIIGIVYRGGLWLDGAMKTNVEIDGLDVTEKISDMIKKSTHYGQIRVIMLSGIAFAGLNIVNIKQLFEFTGLPIIALNRKEPNINRIIDMVKKLPDEGSRLKSIQEAGTINKWISNRGYIYIQFSGLLMSDVEKILETSCRYSNIPEPLRVAHIVASGFMEPII